MKKIFTLFTLLLCVVSSAWATEETISLVSYIVSNNTASLTSTSENLAITLSRPGGTLPGPASNSRGLRWQNKCVVSVSVSSGNKINSVTVTTSKNGNNTTSIEFTLTDGTNALSGTWDNSLTGSKQNDYKWTATANTYYASWVLTNTGSNGDLYISSITVNYETATVQNAAPTIVTQPESKVDAYVGFEATLTVGATGYPTPTYQWYQNSTASNVGGTAIDGATNATYTFTPTTEGTFYYYAVATNTFSNETHTATSNVSTVTVGTKYSVNFVSGNSGATVSIPPAEVFYPRGTEITLPTNHYFYLEGSSVAKWSDGENEYAPGANYIVNKNVTFYPVFSNNTKALGAEETTITWTFSREAGAPLYAIEGNGKTTTVIGTTANGIDLAMDVVLSVNPDNNKEYGKFNNTGYIDRAQVNKYTSFTIPAVKGMIVTYVGTSGTAAVADPVTFGGAQATSVNGSTYTYEYTGEEATLTISDLQSGRYPSGITVQYPFTGIPGPADPENMILVATITWDGGSVNDGKWVSSKNENYKFSGTTKRSNTTYFKIVAGTYTINVPSDMAISNIAICGYSKSNDGTPCQVGETSKTFTTATSTEMYDIVNPTAGADVTFTTSSKEMDIIAIYLYSADGLTLTTTTSMQGWRAFYDADNSYTVDENTKVYVAKNENEGKVTLTEYAAGVPAGTPVILKTSAEAETDGTFKMTLTKTTETITPAYTGESLLKVTPLDGNVYRLGSKSGEVGFFPFNATGAAAGIVVLNVDSSNAGARGLGITFDDETTAIHNVKDNMDVNKNVYDLQGRSVAKPTKGLYIVNGKKVVIK